LCGAGFLKLRGALRKKSPRDCPGASALCFSYKRVSAAAASDLYLSPVSGYSHRGFAAGAAEEFVIAPLAKLLAPFFEKTEKARFEFQKTAVFRRASLYIAREGSVV